MTEYRVDAYARVPYAAFIHANSREEAWEIAEKKAKEFSIDAIGSELLEDKEIHKLCKILDRIIKQMSPEEQDKLEDAEVFIGYYHD